MDFIMRNSHPYKLESHTNVKSRAERFKKFLSLKKSGLNSSDIEQIAVVGHKNFFWHLTASEYESYSDISDAEMRVIKDLHETENQLVPKDNRKLNNLELFAFSD